MNLPNKITLFRIVMIPFFVFYMNIDNKIAGVLFVIAAASDALDGYLARKYNLITNFGKLMDPLADKVLVMAGMIMLLENSKIPAYTVIIILAREFIISGIRLVAAGDNIIIAAGKLGKLKTICQMVSLIVLIFSDGTSLIGLIIYYIAVILTVVSLVEYIYVNKEVFK